jgi:biopolymer transport protein ExbD
MADFTPPAQKRGKGIRKSKKLSTRVDLTPMVDLGFLLITFFIFTTSMSDPKSMKLILPDDRAEVPVKIQQGAVLQLVLGEKDKIFYYYGDDIQNLKPTYYGSKVRDIIIEKRKDVEQRYGSAKEFMMIIKPMPGSTIKNFVSILDEVLINQVAKYVITEPSVTDIESVNR